MIARTGKDNFFAAHYDWIVLGVGILALVGAAVFYALAIGEDADEAAANAVSSVARLQPSENGVVNPDMSGFAAATRLVRNPVTLAEIRPGAASFLASERRVKCKCGAALVGDVKLMPKCPACGAEQEVEKAVVLDADADGLPDEWEKKHSLNPSDAADANADADSDGFTNLEEFLAKTDPTNPKDHPDYLDSLKLQLPLKETYMPFIFLEARPVGKTWRCEFFNPSQKDDYGRMGCPLTAMVGEDIVVKTVSQKKTPSGFTLKSYEKKTAKRTRKGMKGEISVDVSEATVVRKSDGKVLTLVKAANKKSKPAPADVQATLLYERGTARTIDVVPGSEIDLNGTKYKIVDVKAVGKGGEVTVEHSISGKKTVIKALE